MFVIYDIVVVVEQIGSLTLARSNIQVGKVEEAVEILLKFEKKTRLVRKIDTNTYTHTHTLGAMRL